MGISARPEANFGAAYLLEPEDGVEEGRDEMRRESPQDPFTNAISPSAPIASRTEEPESSGKSAGPLILISSLERKVDKILESECSSPSRAAHHAATKAVVNEIGTHTSAAKEVKGVVKRLVATACSFGEVKSDWENGRAGLKPLKEIWRKRKHLCYRDKDMLRMRLEVMLYYYSRTLEEIEGI